MRFRKIIQLTLFMITLFALAACGSTSESDGSSSTTGETNENEGAITIGQINWPENIAVTNMWKAILEDEGYDVELQLIEMGPQMSAVAEGDLDVAPEVWLPVQDKNYYEQYKDEANFFEEPWYDNGKVGLAVPAFMEDINSIEDLNENKDTFEGEIIGFEPGAGTMLTTEEMMEEYNLDYELVESSEAAMITSVIDAAETQEPIVAPLWKPHYVFSEVDLKFLEDPNQSFGEVEEIFMATREGFDADFEEVSEWLTNFKLDDDQLGELMIDVQDNEDNPMEGAEKWVEENQDLIDGWME
ncbi:glycine betaine ABC transporter substrate-binding protein [Virgibacillus sp. NKC19-3]|uniref:glycine betaine ABC transporter substrate-binding protein n=1 Tax=Virgibacillus saliphilus TaxID=2831674 RepID=UPI001C9B05E3|nr:glycine betaine ABC transporter substrate-binding protein [Virgibacillus sp. NKC19-3]MBY7142430.1 glycine betaine ABC transporter substrate-binding protein [Virgibacillus sp. NKC19-3]